jgi:hypothetical protein
VSTPFGQHGQQLHGAQFPREHQAIGARLPFVFRALVHAAKFLGRQSITADNTSYQVFA